MFVVHKHAARALHYDLRLELEGVLKSWAVPKGPSLDPSVKRLAVMVEDHPLDYRDFEGVIPEGNYGAGSVIIWDRGFYRHPSATDEDENEKLLLEGLRKGDLKFVLEGEKLHGEFALVKTGKDGKSWLLLKKKDRYAANGDILKENRSVVSHKTLEEMLETGAGKSFRQRKISQIRLHEAKESEELKDAPVKADAAQHKTDARDPGQRTVRPSGLALRGEMGRLPGRGRNPGRKRCALFPQPPPVERKVLSHRGVAAEIQVRGRSGRRDRRRG